MSGREFLKASSLMIGVSLPRTIVNGFCEELLWRWLYVKLFPNKPWLGLVSPRPVRSVWLHRRLHPANGRAFYRSTELTADITYSIVYTLFLGLFISWLFQRGFSPDSKMQKWKVTPVGAWLFDLLENIGIVMMLSAWPSQPVVVAWLTTLFTVLKWLFVGASILLSPAGLVMAAKNRFKKST